MCPKALNCGRTWQLAVLALFIAGAGARASAKEGATPEAAGGSATSASGETPPTAPAERHGDGTEAAARPAEQPKSTEELLFELEHDVMVSVASKAPERVSDAPGVLTVITAADIKAFGARTLFEVLGRLPGAYPTGSFLFSDNVLSVRGEQITHFNSHVLLLLNGRPMRESVYGGIDESIFASFPLSMIDRIEVIRGPGSVLYGANAYAGVVNIISRQPTKTTAQLSGAYGDHNTGSMEACWVARSTT